MIWGPLEPYVLYAKIAIAVALLAAAGVAGWTVRGWKCDAALTSALEQQAELHDKQIADYKAELAKQEKFKDDQRLEYQRDKASRNARLAQVEEDLRNAKLTPEPQQGETLDPAYPFSRDFLRLWNDAIRAANGAPPDAEARPDVSGADTSAARVTREDVISAIKNIAGIYAGCKLKHDKIIEYEKGGSP